MSRPQKAILIHSPYSGRSAQLPEVIAHLRQRGIDITSITSIANLDGLPPQGSTWREQGIDIVVAAGGDGLVGGVITHIAESGLLLGILPLGTANDIARSLSLPQDLQQATDIIAHGRVSEIDIGVAHPAEQAPHHTTQGGKTASKVPQQKHGYFAHALTVGVNVQFAQLATNIAMRQRYGSLTYPITAFEVLRNHTALDMQFRFEGLALPPYHATPSPTSSLISEETATLHCRTLLAAVINAPIFGGALQLSIPGAQVNDHLLDIVIVEDISAEHFNSLLEQVFSPSQKYAPHITANQQSLLQKAELITLPGIHHLRARGIVITTSVDPQDVTLDGEIRGQTPIYVHTADKRLQVLTPQHAPGF